MLNSNSAHCIVKWFNPRRGFGFLKSDSHDADIFIHFSVINKCGLDTLSVGDEILCELEYGETAPKVIKILELIKTKPHASTQYNSHNNVGTVKWFNKNKGYGFILCNAGSRDIYFTSRNVKEEELDLIFADVEVVFSAIPGANGIEAINLRLAESD
jgi:CspA family cold shock protein